MSDSRRYAVWPNPRSRSWALQSWKSDHFNSYLLRHLLWKLATDHGFLNQGTISEFERRDFLIFGLVFVSRDFDGHKRHLWRVDRQSLYGAKLFLPSTPVSEGIMFFVCLYTAFVRSFIRTDPVTRYLMNRLNNFNETSREYSQAPTDDLVRFWRSNVKVTSGHRGGKGTTLKMGPGSLSSSFL